MHVWQHPFMCDTAHSYVIASILLWHDSSICDMTAWHDPSICDMTISYVTWLIHMLHDPFTCDMTHVCVSWLIHMRMPHSYATWLIHMWHDSYIYDKNHLSLTWTNSCLTTHPYVHPYSFFYPRQKKQWHRAKKCSSSSVPIYTSARIYFSFLCCFGADIGGTLLERDLQWTS